MIGSTNDPRKVKAVAATPSSLSGILQRMGSTHRNTILVHRIACTETARTVLRTVVSTGVRDIVHCNFAHPSIVKWQGPSISRL